MKQYNINPIQEWQKKLKQKISLTIHTRRLDSNDTFYAYGKSLADQCENIDIAFDKTTSDFPEIQIIDNLHFHSIPDGTEINPFLTALGYQSKPPEMLPLYTDIQTLSETSLILFVSPHCPNCPTMLQSLLPIVWFNPKIDLSIIDAGLFPEHSERHNIHSVPTLLYKSFKWTGEAKITEIVDIIKNKPEEWHIKSLERMISEGKAIQLGEAVLDRGQFFEQIDSLIAHELLSMRLGAMVCVEKVAEDNHPLAQTLCDTIWTLIPTVNEQVQGDLIYLSGICGNDSHIPKLEQLATQVNNEDIKEAISEAIETIQGQ